MRLPATWLAVLSTAFAAGSACAAPSPDDVALLQQLQVVARDDTAAVPESALESSSCPVRLVATALAYRRDPDVHRNAFFAQLVVDDYAKRAAGEYEILDTKQAGAIIEAAATAPEGIEDNRITSSIGFCELRDRNLWLVTENAGRVSIARLMRGMALSVLLAGTDEDVLAIADAIDRQTAKRQGHDD